jgi:hypothetical protein
MASNARKFLRLSAISAATAILACTLVPQIACSRLSAAGSIAAGDPPATESAGTKKVEIRDPNMNNMVAYTLIIPANWNFQGAVLLDPVCGTSSNTVVYRVWSDDLKYGVQRMPEFSWFTPSDSRILLGKCKTMEGLSAVQYAGTIMPVLRPNSQLISTSTAPQADGLAAAAKQMEATVGASAARYGQPAPKYGWDAKEFRIQYNLGSQPEEEFLQVMESTSDTPSSIIVSRPGQILRTQWAMNKRTTAWIVAERAPKGQLDAVRAKLEAIRSSLAINPAWDQAMAQLIQQRGAAMIAQSWKTFNANYKANEIAGQQRLANGQAFIDNMQAQGDKRNADFAAYEDSRTRATADKVDQILHRQYYVDPSSGQTSTISTTYTNNWSSGGDTILTNLQGYDPNGYVQGNWTQLQPIKH